MLFILYIMLATIKGYYEKGRIVMSEDAPVQSKTDVIITFLTEPVENTSKKRIPGGKRLEYPCPKILMSH